MARKREVGFYNQTHKHGEPLENLIAKLKARRAHGSDDRGGDFEGLSRDPSLDREASKGWGEGVNRAAAAKLPVGVAADVKMYPAPQGLAGVTAPNFPAGATPKPLGPNPLAPGAPRPMPEDQAWTTNAAPRRRRRQPWA